MDRQRDQIHVQEEDLLVAVLLQVVDSCLEEVETTYHNLPHQFLL